MTPWTIIGWLILGTIALVVLAFVVSLLKAVVVDQLYVRKSRRAHKGKLTCEAPTCKNKAAYRTPNGYYCHADRIEFCRKPINFGTVSWSTKLDYLKEK